VPRLLSVTSGNTFYHGYEVSIPELSTGPSYNTATVLQDWGDIYDGKKLNNDRPTGELSDNNITVGLYWDEPTQRLYWNYGFYYNPTGGAAWGCSTLDDGTGVATGVAAWSIGDLSTKITRGGCLRMPDWFVDANCPGKPMAVGFGSPSYSTAAESSKGPALIAVPSPDLGTYPHDSTLPTETLWLYEWTSGERARRDPDYKSAIYGHVAAATSTTITLSGVDGEQAYADGRYDGYTFGIYEGTGTGQTRVLTWVSGLQYSVSPAWDPTPDTASKYESVDYPDTNSVVGPIGDVGYWTLGDAVRQSLVWVDGASKHGILVGVTFRTGRQYYGPGGPNYEDARHAFQVYDPADLAAVAQGTLAEDAVDPIAEWTVEFPDHLGIDKNESGYLGGMAFDPATNRLYVAVRDSWLDGSETKPKVYVFEVNN
jgi:hypothetical protein